MGKINKQHAVEFIKNTNGPTLSYVKKSGVKLIKDKALFFKDLNKDGKLDKYEDWRLAPQERAEDLASKMTIEQIAGLMLYSKHQAVPGSLGWHSATYSGKSFDESGAEAFDLTDEQRDFIEKDHLRHVLVTKVDSPAVAAQWNNNLQALAEGTALGIPANNSSDPRHSTDSTTEFNFGAGGEISMWPEALGIAATFDPAVAERFGKIASKEYRALGLATALSPQVDIATDPRWYRFNMTFGEDPQLSADMGRAYIDGFQTSTGEAEIDQGWGYDSVNTMVKHWPGGGSGEAGRDAHFGYGKYAVYPGENFEQHLIPFIKGAFKLKGNTKQASAVMPYYTISYKQDLKNGEDVGNSYSSYIIKDLLREKYGYDGVVCTDWGITEDEPEEITSLWPGGRSWGVEQGYTAAERHYKVIMAGVDQFGGNNEAAPIMEAYRIGVKEHGEAFMRQRFEQSAVRLLKNMFRLGLFENPYVKMEDTIKTVGCSEFMEAGYEAQLKSLVMLKNESQVLPFQKHLTIYIPNRYRGPGKDWIGNPIPAKEEFPLNRTILEKYFHIADYPDEADFALVCIESPKNTMGYSKEDKENGGNGYVPISLQYEEYQAEHARETSIAGDKREVLNRSYKNKTVTVVNASDSELVRQTKEVMNGKPVIVSLRLDNPTVISEFEKESNAIIANFGVQDQAICDVLVGNKEPEGLLPFQMPANMATVEQQKEDVPHDMEVYVDSAENAYDFAYGLNWSGNITDKRTNKYKKRRNI